MHTVNTPSPAPSAIPGGVTQPHRHTASPHPLVSAEPPAVQHQHDPGMPLSKRKKQKKRIKPVHSLNQATHDVHRGSLEGDEEDDDEDYIDESGEAHGNRGRDAHRAYQNTLHHHSASPGDELLSEDDEAVIDALTAPDEKSKKKKKKKRGSDAGHTHRHSDIWYKSDAEEKQRIREFWLQLGEEERRALVKLEKEAVLKKMKEQQKQTCSCSLTAVANRTVIEEELEILYDAYYEELENFANDQGTKSIAGPPIAFNHINLTHHRPPPPPPPPLGHIQHEMRGHDLEYDDEDDEDDEDEDDDGDYGHDPSESIFEFGSSLTVKGGILTVADDFLKNDGRKFLDLMEQLAERKIRQLDDEMDRNGDGNVEWDDGDYDDEEYDEEEEEDTMTEEQRMEEGRRMFQIFAAKMFEQRVLQAYREKVAQERQAHLLAELEKEKELNALRELTRQKNKEKKRQQKKAVKQQKEEERLAIERKKQEEDERVRLAREAKLEADRLRREAEKARKEADRALREEEERKKREAEKVRRDEEKRKAKDDANQKRRREKEDRERQDQERKEREDIEQLELERQAREEQALATEREEKEKRDQEDARARQLAAASRTGKGAAGKPAASAASKSASQAVASVKSQPAPASPQRVAVRPPSSSAQGRTTRPSPTSVPHPSPAVTTLPSFQAVQASVPHRASSAPNSVPPMVVPRFPQHVPTSHAHPPMPFHPMVSPYGTGQGPPGPRPQPMFTQPSPHPLLHPPQHMHAVGPVSPQPPMGLPQPPGKGSELPLDGMYTGSTFPSIHWGPADAAPPGQPFSDLARGAPSMGSLPASSSRPELAIGGPSKAITRPAPIRRPSAVASQSVVDDFASPSVIGGSSRRGLPGRSGGSGALDEEGPVAGSAALGGEVLKDDERIGGGMAWRSTNLRKPSLVSPSGIGAPAVPSMLPMSSIGSTGGNGSGMLGGGSGADAFVGVAGGGGGGVPANLNRMFEGFSPFGGTWDGPPTSGGLADASRAHPAGVYPPFFHQHQPLPLPPHHQQQQQQQQQQHQQQQQQQPAPPGAQW
ncbi:Stress response protein nst1 [Thoreauomyces humboldtii]|nr:Stress response protein nst1 [Thoreauomyces humboldtii]